VNELAQLQAAIYLFTERVSYRQILDSVSHL